VSGSTTVRGRLDSNPRNGALVYQARLGSSPARSRMPWLRRGGTVSRESRPGTEGDARDFVFTVAGDRRGQYIIATFTRSRIDSFSTASQYVPAVAPAGRFSEFPSETSELSNVVQVQ
jgi:hypothetical protein